MTPSSAYNFVYIHFFFLLTVVVMFTEGEWKDDKRHGKGKLTYVSGLQYEVRVYNCT